jgi:predicted ArsR family transcriptional regulator
MFRRRLEIVTMPALLEDHGLPLVQLKERRRDLIVALMGQHGPMSEQQIAEIASIQSAILAFEAVLDDLDAEAEVTLRDRAA